MAEEPGGLQFMGLQGVGDDLASAVLSRSVVSDSVQPRGLQPARLLSLSMGILQARILPNPGIKPRSPTLQSDFLPSEPQWKP